MRIGALRDCGNLHNLRAGRLCRAGPRLAISPLRSMHTPQIVQNVTRPGKSKGGTVRAVPPRLDLSDRPRPYPIIAPQTAAPRTTPTAAASDTLAASRAAHTRRKGVNPRDRADWPRTALPRILFALSIVFLTLPGHRARFPLSAPLTPPYRANFRA